MAIEFYSVASLSECLILEQWKTRASADADSAVPRDARLAAAPAPPPAPPPLVLAPEGEARRTPAVAAGACTWIK